MSNEEVIYDTTEDEFTERLRKLCDAELLKESEYFDDAVDIADEELLKEE